MRSKEQPEDHVDVIITPFIDVFIFLLIAFMAGTILEKVTNSLEINLPSADHSQKATTPDEMVVISILPKRAAPGEYVYFIGSDQVTRNGLEKGLHEASSNPERRVRIDCDQTVPFKQVSYVVDLCEFVGLHNIGLRTKDTVGPR